MKTLTGWTYRHLDRFGTVEWTTPMGEKYIDEPAVKMRGEPHLDNAIRQRLLDPGDVLQHNDRIPQDLYAQWQAEMDAEIEADRMALARALLIG